MGVVKVSLVVIVEDFVGLADQFEFDFGFSTFALCNFVRMARQCGLIHLSVCGIASSMNVLYDRPSLSLTCSHLVLCLEPLYLDEHKRDHRHRYPANHTGLFLLQRRPLIMVSVNHL